MNHVRTVILVSALATSLAASESEDAPKKQLRLWRSFYQEIADSYEFRLKSRPSELLKVSPQPIHVYSNPAGGRDSNGAFFVWTQNGRAEAIGAIWSWQAGENRRAINHEFQSLSTEPFVASSPRGVRWAPEKAGLDLKEVKNAPEPSPSKTARMSQMRRLAREFTGYHVHPTERQLRLLTNPLYRYDVESGSPGEVSDGAVFAMFMDWDPELILVLEVRRTSTGPKWHFGAGRCSNKPLRLQYKGEDVWKHSGNFGGPADTFYAKLNVELRPAVIEE